MLKGYITLLLTLGCIANAIAQITIAPNSTMEVQGLIAVNGSVNNASALTGLTAAEMILNGSNQTITTTAPISIQTLEVNGGGVKTLEGNWSVTSQLLLNDGVVTVGPNAKLVYSGTGPAQGSTSSWINGYLYIQGAGELFFPIGTSTAYAPAMVSSAPSGEHGIRVVSGDVALGLPTGVDAYFTGHYWETTGVNGRVGLSINGLENFLTEGAPVILEGDAAGGLATSLSGTLSDSFVRSASAATLPVLAVGRTAEFTLVIHDLITPYVQEGVNDKLFIRNIEMTNSNTVKLLDRWGVLVKEWTNYSNDVEYDFSALSPGNYICLVEYTAPGNPNTVVAKGMVTVLKTN